MSAKPFLIFCTLFFPFAVIAQNEIDGELLVGSTKRQYTLHLPPTYRTGTPLPLVMIFHGGGGNGRQVQRYFQMDAIADKEGFITVYPSGIRKQWNDGREFKESVTTNDDVQFIDQLLDTLVKNYAVDTNRVFATGISNGGFFSIFLSYKLSHRLLAVAPICASIPELIYPGFYPAKPISVLIINGTDDPLVPYKGGTVGNRLIGDRGNCISTDSTIRRYIAINRTTTIPLTENMPDTDKTDKCTAIKYTWTAGINDTKVCLIKIVNGGHTLPGATPYLKMIAGRVCNDFAGNAAVWEFFKNCKPR